MGDQTVVHAVKHHKSPTASRQTSISIPEFSAETTCPLSNSIIKLQLTDKDRKSLGTTVGKYWVSVISQPYGRLDQVRRF